MVGYRYILVFHKYLEVSFPQSIHPYLVAVYFNYERNGAFNKENYVD